MSKEMIISVNGREKKIAIIEDGRVSEFYIERGDEENSGIVGNIYKGRVQRVLPGMQSAFVGIGLERDGFLYVSDFFDEEEEIERIVMEKSKKSSPDEAKREADEQIQRARIEREKQMEAVQEIAEPLSDADEDEDNAETPEIFKEEPEQPKRGKPRRDRQVKQNEEVEDRKPARNDRNKPEKSSADENAGEDFGEKSDAPDEPAETYAPLFDFDMEDSNFERIVDSEETTGDMFKDAYRQEAIVDKVRAIEFDMEGAATAEVGSLLDTINDQPNGFERIADDDDEQTANNAPVVETDKPKRGGRRRTTGDARTKTKAAAKKTGEDAENQNEPTKKNMPKSKKSATNDESGETAESETGAETGDETKSSANKPSRKKSRGGKRHSKKPLEDASASVRESDSNAEMAVRRGGRNRRRQPNERQDGETEKPDDKQKPDEKEEPIIHRNERGEQISEKDSYRPDNKRRPGRRERTQPTITDLLREGQEILVQIAKEPIAKKGARITSHIALPGRFLVYMPTIEHLGVSRKIESASERARLRVSIQKIRSEEDIPSGGFIVRTAGVGITEQDLRQDAKYLVRTWLDVRKQAEKSKSPALVHQDLDIIQRLLRDQLSDDFAAIRVDSEEEYEAIVEFINRIQPRMVSRVKLYTRDEPILEAYNVQEEVDKALKPRVWLKSGGYLVINQTEALVAIDVNTGKFVGRGNARLEDTITKTNMEAVDEIARQIRLRDLGGIIVLDLIDMEDRRNRYRVQQALQDALASDKSPTKVLSFNDFGLIIMTRKRVKQSLERTMCDPCEYCQSAGWVKSAQTICYEILGEARRLSKNAGDVRQTTLRVHPDVAKALRESERQVLEEIEDYLGNVDVTGDKSIHQEQFDFAFI